MPADAPLTRMPVPPWSMKLPVVPPAVVSATPDVPVSFRPVTKSSENALPEWKAEQ